MERKVIACLITSGVAPAALTVATATEISAADKGSKGWLVCNFNMTGMAAEHNTTKTT